MEFGGFANCKGGWKLVGCQLSGWMEIGGVPIVKVDENWWGANCQGGWKLVGCQLSGWMKIGGVPIVRVDELVGCQLSG